MTETTTTPPPPKAPEPAIVEPASIPEAKPQEATSAVAAAAVTQPEENPFELSSEFTAALPATPPAISPPASLTPPTSTEDTTTTEVPTQPPNEPQLNPQVATLHGMFPDFDTTIIQEVLQSVSGDQDRAIDTLLGMSDPDYQSQQPPVAPAAESDEEFARRLYMEDQQAQQRNWTQQPDPQIQNTPYEPRHSWQPGNQGGGVVAPTGGQSGGQKDTVAEFQEQFIKIAETGKKTFGSIFNKVKAKVQEFDQQRQGQGSSTTGGAQPSWGTGAVGGPPQQHLTQSQQQQQSYYDPNPRIPSPQSPNSAQGYDMSSPTTPPPVTAPKPTMASHTTPPGVTLSDARTASPPTTSTPPPPRTIAGTPPQNPAVDFGKIGLLPKRPVSLLKDPAPVQNQPADEDELEYVENPFEEERK